MTRRGSDWYLRTAHAELNDYFCECNARLDLFDYPYVKSFYDQVPAKHSSIITFVVVTAMCLAARMLAP